MRSGYFKVSRLANTLLDRSMVVAFDCIVVAVDLCILLNKLSFLFFSLFSFRLEAAGTAS